MTSGAPARALFAVLVLATLAGCGAPMLIPTLPTDPKGPPPMPMSLTSPAFAEGQEIPVENTCDGSDVPFALTWSGAPDWITQFALIVDDPDARGFVHWFVVGIPPSATELVPGLLPAGAIEQVNDFGRRGYGGPCPPSGTHRYDVRLYGITVPMSDAASLTADQVRGMRSGVAMASLHGKYTRRR